MRPEAEILWVNGRLVPAGEARLDPRDRGYTLGDGLFETMRARDGALPWINRHLARMRAGAAVLGLPLPADDELESAIRQTLAVNDLSEAVVRLTVSRGVPTERGLLPDPEPKVSVVVHARPFAGYPAELYERGMRAITSRIPRNEYSPLANIKSLSYLENALTRREAAERGADEALLLNISGNLACASAANLFLVLGDSLVTPDLASGVLPGTMRELVLGELAPQAGLSLDERPIRPGELATAHEAFLTSTLLGIMPLTHVDGRQVGEGTPGPVARELGARLEHLRKG
ncbi:MAG: aminotransferase class IV [Chloroflexota bacterium]|nr:aminotransferase class IV [Chloroflexota bacterium]